MLKIVQLTDSHLSAQADAVYRGINPREQLEKLLPRVESWQPDLLLLTGDLAEDASDEAYAFLASRLGPMGIPILTVPGNHDLPERQARHFPETPTDGVLVHETTGWQLLLLNTAAEGQIDGHLSDEVLEQLAKHLQNNPKPGLLVLHHQPVPVGSPWIDRYPLREPEKLWSCLEEAGNVRAVIWGHVHQEFESSRGGARLLGTPAASVSSLPGKEKFTPDGNGPAARWLKLASGGDVETGILRVN